MIVLGRTWERGGWKETRKEKQCEKTRKDATGLRAWPYPISNEKGRRS